jgi:hypothetical protein
MSQRNERSTQLVLNSVTRWLIKQAARGAPEHLCARLEEEWLADLEYRSSGLPRLRLALGCCWATMVIISEHSRARVTAASPVVATMGSTTRADRSFGYLSLPSGTLFLILGLHAALFGGLITTLSHARGWATQPNLPNQVLNRIQSEIEITDLSRR